MEREEMIEEMAKVTCGYKVHCKNCQKVHPSECADRSFATMFIDAGYRKIPEGAVVLTQEMAYEYREDLAKVKYLKDEIRKETLSEVLKKVDDESNGQTIMITNYLRKKYGVEVK